MLARYEFPLYDVMPHHLQSGDYLAWTVTAFPRDNILDGVQPHLPT